MLNTQHHKACPYPRHALQDHMHFYVGLHQPSDARRFDRAFISVNRLVGPKGRKTPFTNKSWIMDSGAFTTIAKHGGYPQGVGAYARVIREWAGRGDLVAAVAQDYMCEPHMVERTGLTVREHQRLTVERYDALRQCDTGSVPVLPVLQGYVPGEYVTHLRDYGDRLQHEAYVGVGSVCKRNADPQAVLDVLQAIKTERPDLRLHGFGLKLTSLRRMAVRALLYSADSMAWSYAARRQGGGNNDWRVAKDFEYAVSFFKPTDPPRNKTP